MRKSFALLASAALLGLNLAAHATPVTFNVSASGGGYSPQYSLFAVNYSGTITIDTSTYQVTAEDIQAVINGTTTFYFDNTTFGATDASANYSYIAAGETLSGAGSSTGSAAAAVLHIGFVDPASELYNGGAIDFNMSGLSFSAGGGAGVNGTIGPAVSSPTPSPTPEPSSIVLLGTGLLGFAAAARRRFATTA